jgi:hypothetical protein
MKRGVTHFLGNVHALDSNSGSMPFVLIANLY